MFGRRKFPKIRSLMRTCIMRESFGWHQAFADTIDELVEDIRSFGVPYYSGGRFLSMLRDNDKKEIARDRQVELYFDSRGTKVTRGEYGINNMTEYTSF